MSGRTKFLHCVCVCMIPRVSPCYRGHSCRDCLHTSQVSPVLSEEPSSSCNRLPTIYCEWDVFSFSTKTCSYPRVYPFDHRLVWVWIELVWKIQHEVLPKRLLNEFFPTGLMFNCRTRLIIPFSPIVIVFQ